MQKCHSSQKKGAQSIAGTVTARREGTKITSPRGLWNESDKTFLGS